MIAETSITVLVAEDDEDLLALASFALATRSGIIVVPCNSCSEAVELIQTQRPQIVLTDDRLGDGTSIEVLAAAGDIPVIVLSAGIDDDESALFVALGFRAAVSKPYNPMDLPAIVERAIA